ncbi:MAG: MBL fold metallo-hydrolase [Solirubrobacterales bacterium]|nr:MBL fold metallo-hydrolase [Solirubrobacterales bacterium]
MSGVGRINQNLIQVSRFRLVNAFLVREDDGFTLVDTTVGGGADTLIEAARTGGGEIERIALTHAHGDHVGSLDALKQKLGNTVEVLMPELDARILDGEPATLVFGHGGPVRAPAVELDKAIARAGG